MKNRNLKSEKKLILTKFLGEGFVTNNYVAKKLTSERENLIIKTLSNSILDRYGDKCYLKISELYSYILDFVTLDVNNPIRKNYLDFLFVNKKYLLKLKSFKDFEKVDYETLIFQEYNENINYNAILNLNNRISKNCSYEEIYKSLIDLYSVLQYAEANLRYSNISPEQLFQLLVKKNSHNYERRFKLFWAVFSEFGFRYKSVSDSVTISMYPCIAMDTELENRYYQIGMLLGLSDKQAKYFSCKALGYDRETICEVTETKYRSLEGVKRDIGKKLGFGKESSEFKDTKMKELAEELLQSETLNALEKTYDSTIQEKIDIAREYRENKQIADMVRANPELLQAYQQMQQNQND